MSVIRRPAGLRPCDAREGGAVGAGRSGQRTAV